MWPGLIEWARSSMLAFDPPLANPEDMTIPRCAANAERSSFRWPFLHIETASFFSTTLIERRPTVNFVDLFNPSNPFHPLANNIVPAVVLFSVSLVPRWSVWSANRCCSTFSF